MSASGPAPVRHVLLPGRHHVLTRAQASYLRLLVQGGLTDSAGAPVVAADDVRVVWAVTSANHSGTRRNPVAASRREAAVERLLVTESLDGVVVPVVDVPATDRFAAVTVRTVETALRLTLDVATTLVACSTPAVAALYAGLGHRLALVEADPAFAATLGLDPAAPGAERQHPEDGRVLRPWDVLGLLVEGDDRWRDLAHPATVSVFDRYGLADAVRTVTADLVVGDEGGLTDTRSYRSYMASFEAAAERKWQQARPHVVPGRIVDVGCASGAMLELAAADPALAESDLYGVEVARTLLAECEHKKSQGAFANPNVFFLHANVLTGPVMAPATVHTTTSFALTHELYSYGQGRASVLAFARELFAHTAPGGVWINSDVCGPAERDRVVDLVFSAPRTLAQPLALEEMTAHEQERGLEGLGGADRLVQFASDFPRLSRAPLPVTWVDDRRARLPLGAAMEFVSKATYTGNWLSECHEQFTGLDEAEWSALATEAGFVVDPGSRAWRNDWVCEHLFDALAALCEPDGDPDLGTGPGGRLPWPDTHLLLVARRPLTS